jgi:hypothetical protein
VFLIKGCGIDLCINILLTLLGYIPGHIHAFYLEYVYYKRREDRAYLQPQGTSPSPNELNAGVYGQPQYGTIR